MKNVSKNLFLLISSISISSFALAQTFSYDDSNIVRYKYPWLEIANYNYSKNTCVNVNNKFIPLNNNNKFNLNLPFSLNFGGDSFTSLEIHSNGFLNLGKNISNSNTNIHLGYLTSGVKAMFPLWVDLDPVNKEEIYFVNSNMDYFCSGVYYSFLGTAPNRKVVIQYNYILNKDNYKDRIPLNYFNTFQVQLHESGDIVYKYKNIRDDGKLATVGISVDGKDDYTQYGYKASIIEEDTTILWNGSGLLDHYELDFISGNSALTCMPQKFNIRACKTSKSPCLNASEQSTSSNNLLLKTSLGKFTSSNSNTTTRAIISTLNDEISSNIEGTANITTEVGGKPLSCFSSGVKLASCNITFSDSGFVFEWDNKNKFNSENVVVAGDTSEVVTVKAVKKNDVTKACTTFKPTNTNLNISYINPSSGNKNLTLINSNSSGSIGSSFNVGLNNQSIPLVWNNGVSYFKVNYLDAGKIALNLSGNSENNTIVNGTTSFVSKPSNLQVYKTNGDVVCADNTIMSLTDSSKKFCKSGETFTTKVRAFAKDNTTILPNFGNETNPTQINLSAKIKSPVGGDLGNFDFSQRNKNCVGSDCYVNMDLIWDNVGELDIVSSVPDYLGVGVVPGEYKSFGRFYPSGFKADNFSLINRSDLNCTPKSEFTNMDENFKILIRLKAVNKNDEITENYKYEFDPSLASSWNIHVLNGEKDLTSRVNFVSGVGTWNKGVLSAVLTLKINRNALPDGPFGNVKVSIKPVDKDGVSYVNADLDFDTNKDGANDTKLVETTKIYFGKMQINNSSGSDLLPQIIGLNTQYFNGYGFITNTEDNCTTLSQDNFKLNNFKSELTSNEIKLNYPSVVNSGSTYIKLNKPSGGDGKYVGSFDVEYDLVNNNKNYLLGNYLDSSNYNSNPKGTIIIKQTKNNQKVLIYKPTP